MSATSVIENSGEGTDTVRTTLAAYALSANVEHLRFIGVGNFTGTGNDLNNDIYGGGGNDTLYGGDGHDHSDRQWRRRQPLRRRRPRLLVGRHRRRLYGRQ